MAMALKSNMNPYYGTGVYLDCGCCINLHLVKLHRLHTHTHTHTHTHSVCKTGEI